MEPASDWKPPQEFDEYRLVREIGHGGMGQVYLAHDTLLDRLVAVKFVLALEPDPQLRRRFLVEARAAARVQHPNVVAIHRVGELRGRPYIVSEYVRGKTLQDMERPIPWRRALDLGIGLARGLAAAHRRGVLHRDLKPANAILAEDGTVKLLDFGLAKIVDTPGATSMAEFLRSRRSLEAAWAKTEAGSGEAPSTLPGRPDLGVVTAVRVRETEDGTFPGSLGAPADQLTPAHAFLGTPAYTPLELWEGQQATRASDVYSMGALLYALCAGALPWADATSMDRLYQKICNEDPPPLGPSVDPRFGALILRCLARDPARRFASGDDLLDALEKLTTEPASQTASGENPYPGPRPFGEEHRRTFLGRRREVLAVVERLRAESFVLVAGDAGVGKSSMCLAGVLPLVAEGALEDGRTWSVARLIPGDRPTAAVEAALAPHLGQQGIEELIASQPTDLGRQIGQSQGKGRGILLFIDQLEELLTRSPRDQAVTMAEFLDRLSLGIPGVRLVAAVRSDYFGRIAALPGLGDVVGRALFFLHPLSAERVREAIVAPAQASGVRFESEADVDALVEVGATAGLGVLQAALRELWDGRDTARQLVTSAALAQLVEEGRTAARTEPARPPRDRELAQTRRDKPRPGAAPVASPSRQDEPRRGTPAALVVKSGPGRLLWIAAIAVGAFVAAVVLVQLWS